MDSAAGTVFIVNDAREIRTEVLLAAAGYEVRAFESAEHFLEKQDCEAAGCLLLDLCLPGMSGLICNGRLLDRRGHTRLSFSRAEVTSKPACKP